MTGIDRFFHFPEELKVIFQIIAEYGGQSRLVGGCVRDYLSDKKPVDFDVATDVLPEKIMEIFSLHGHKVVPIGLEHGTILVVINHHSFEITTLRKDVQCFGRHAKVEFTNDWESDASRRDFTINALSISSQGVVYDYFGGQEDMKNKIVRFVGNPLERIQEDYLRIMRFFRFLGYFDLNNVDKASYAAAVSQIENLQYISKERIKNELLKLLGAPYGKEVVALLNQKQLLPHIGFSQNISLDNNKLANIAFRKDDPILNLAILILLSGNQKTGYLEKLKQSILLSNKEYKELKSLISFNCDEKFTDFHHYKYWHKYGKELYLRLLFIINSINTLDKYAQYVNEASNNEEHEFPLTGTDLQKDGNHGKIIGQYLNLAKEHWHRHNNDLSKMELLNYVWESVKKPLA
jgi:poly(A) polymerase